MVSFQLAMSHTQPALTSDTVWDNALIMLT
jgi:hypothetical protein